MLPWELFKVSIKPSWVAFPFLVPRIRGYIKVWPSQVRTKSPHLEEISNQVDSWTTPIPMAGFHQSHHPCIQNHIYKWKAVFPSSLCHVGSYHWLVEGTATCLPPPSKHGGHKETNTEFHLGSSSNLAPGYLSCQQTKHQNCPKQSLLKTQYVCILQPKL